MTAYMRGRTVVSGALSSNIEIGGARGSDLKNMGWAFFFEKPGITFSMTDSECNTVLVLHSASLILNVIQFWYYIQHD